MRYQERSLYPVALSGDKIHDSVTITDDVTIFNWTGTDTTMTPTRVDTGTAGATTGTATFNATDSVAAANLQAVIRALGGIYATATVTAGVTADNMIITVYGGYNITWAKTGGAGTITESGAAGSDTAVVGKIAYAKQLPIGKFAEVKKILAKGFVDDSLIIAITDADSKTVFSATVDTHNAGVDVPFLKLLTADGVAGEDGAAASNTSSGTFRGPLTCTVTAQAPYGPVNQRVQTVFKAPLPGGSAAVAQPPRLTLTIAAEGERAARTLQRTTGARTTLTGTLDLGAPIANVRRIRLLASSDTTVAPTLTDPDGLVAYTKSSSDFTTAVLEQLSHEGVDQSNNAVADLLDVICKSPLTLSGSGLGAGTFTVTVWVEV